MTGSSLLRMIRLSVFRNKVLRRKRPFTFPDLILSPSALTFWAWIRRVEQLGLYTQARRPTHSTIPGSSGQVRYHEVIQRRYVSFFNAPCMYSATLVEGADAASFTYANDALSITLGRVCTLTAGMAICSAFDDIEGTPTSGTLTETASPFVVQAGTTALDIGSSDAASTTTPPISSSSTTPSVSGSHSSDSGSSSSGSKSTSGGSESSGSASVSPGGSTSSGASASPTGAGQGNSAISASQISRIAVAIGLASVLRTAACL